MKMWVIVVRTAAALGLLVSFAQAKAASLSREEANEELVLVHAHLMDTHPAPYRYYDRQTWDSVLAELMLGVGPVSEVDHYFHMARLMALATDTHVQVYPGEKTEGFTRSFPVRFRLFEEGIFVSAASGSLRPIVGAKLVSVAGVPAIDVARKLQDYSFSDHPGRKLTWGVEYLMPHPATYKHFGWMDGDKVTLEVISHDGTRSTVELRDTIEGGFWDVLGSGAATAFYWPEGWRTLDDLVPGEAPLSRRHLDQNYWWTELEDGKTLYYQLNGPFNQDGRETLNAHILDFFSQIESGRLKPERLIFDLRYDLGGMIDWSIPLASLSAASRVCCKRGNIVVLIGRETISAGSVLAGAFEVFPRGIMIGEPTGGSPNIFIGHERIELPHSSIEAEASAYRIDSTDSSDVRPFVAPDISVPHRFADIMSGGDPVLEKALSITAEDAEQFYPKSVMFTPWKRPGQPGVD